LDEWLKLVSDGIHNDRVISKIRQDIAKASRVVSRLDRYARVASLVGYIALPIGIAEAITGGNALGLALTPVGPAVDTYSYLKLRKFGWVQFGAV
jgi:hypothetical protein